MANGSRTADYAAALESWRTDAQFAVDYSKRFLGLEHAYARGLTGAGLTIGINDAGVYAAHPLLQGAGKLTGLRTAVPAEYGNDGLINPRRRYEGHGTHVAGTAAGARVAGQLMFGNAFGANIYSATTNFAAGDFLWFKDAFIDGRTVATAQQNIVDLANTGSVRIINNSWGSANSIPFNASMATVRAQLGRNYGDFYDPILENDVLVVFSAGNGGGVHAGVDAAAPLSDPRLRSNWLSVANYTTAGTPSPSTSFCGQTATWCVAGPGHQVISGVPTFTWDRNAINALFPSSRYPTLYSPTTVAALQTAANNLFINVLNSYLNAKRNAELAGLPFDEAAARANVAREAVAISVVVGIRLNDPDGHTSTLANLLTSTNNMAILTPAFSRDVLMQASAEMDRLLTQSMTYTGAGYAAYTGTSMAAPNVSGFAALLMEMFPEYSTGLIADILLSSSVDLDTPGVDLRSGWGAPQMQVALNGPTALRDIRDVTVNVGTVDVWSNNISDARDRYSAEVLANFPNDIGGIVKKGGGELVLTGVNNYTGATNVEGGLLTVNGRLTASDATVSGVGIIGGLGQVLNLTAASGGIVAPGAAANPFGTLTVTGDAVFEAGSFLWVRSSVNGTAHSRLAVQGATTLEGGQVILKADQGNWNLRTRMNILSSAGGVTGTFAGALSDLAFLRPTLSYLQNGVVLTLTRNDVTIASVGANPNQRSAGQALDVMTNRTNPNSPTLALENAILDGSAENVRAALTTLTGEVHATLGGVATGETRFIRDAMLLRGRGGGASRTDASGTTVWATGVFGNGRFEGHDWISDFRSESSGYLGGVERAFSGGHVGLAVGESRSEIRSPAVRSDGDVRSFHLGAYGAYGLGPVDLRAGASWMDSDVRTNRQAAVNQFNNQLSGRYDGEAWQAYGEVAWKVQLDNTLLEPYANYSRIRYKADVIETGGQAALSGEVKHTSDLVTAGVRTETRLTSGPGPEVSAFTNLAWAQDLKDDGPTFAAAFAGGPVFGVQGAQVGTEALLTDLGVNIQATPATSIAFGYAGVHQDDYRDNRVFGRISVKF
ncbi:autotransporter domain-containing protein [Brevundimonas sp. S30B]|uniref:autotransporter domain-containing protein n=1 Tax=unclassified Brevundimonas TaxID=2622653 RepID=UPI001071F292|nr:MULTISPECIES: autotransporter domain-containing protein [unclassified Brevundimonas]QBX38607.1 autotransporter domain-containing protein [Brevundimonas sp. MF30-B]TFW01198.1 autotransporter domain-containing protein [Brevundimonas sp. S30B]